MTAQPIEPVIVRIIEPATAETTVADVLLQAIGLTGALMLTALLLGLACGAVLIGVRILRSRQSLDARQGVLNLQSFSG